jgi:hypothetical protein
MTTSGGAVSTPRDARPGGVTLVAALTWVSGAINLITGVLLLFQLGNADLVARFGGSAVVIALAVAVMILGIVVLIVAGGLFRGSNGARVVSALFQVLSIVAAIFVSIQAPTFLWSSVVSIVVSIAVIALLFSGRANTFFRSS